MKNVLSILLVLNFLTLLNGQTNRLFYKSIFKQADGTPIKNMDLNVLIKISNYNGLDKYSECHIIRTDQNGYGYLWLGFGNDKSGKLESINFESEKHILKILLKDFQVYRWTDIYCTPFSKYPNLPESLHPSNIINESNIFYWGGIKLKALGIGYNNEVLSIEHDDNIEDKAYSDEIKAGKSFVEKLSDEEVIIKSSTNLKNYLQKGFVFDLLPQPNLLYSKSITIPNSNINTFQSKIGNLELNKIYYIRSYITYENDTIYGETAKFQLDKKINVQSPCPNVPKIFDIDGNSYNTVQIGNQCWTKENLKVTKFRDGSLIQIDESGDVTGSTTGQTWTSQTIGKRTIYSNDKTKLLVYGYLYNWFVVSDPRGICPIGWHVPEREELSLLINFLGGERTAGSKLKEKSNNLWQNSNLENSNESGFSGFPGGIRGIIKGGYSGIGSKGVWWSSTKYDKDDAYKMELENNSNDAKVGLTSMMNGFSIRCVKDNLKNTNDSIPKISTIQITDVTSNSAQSGGSISSEGGSDIIAKGVVWSRSKRPDILTDSTTREGKGIGTFSSVLSDLISGKKYFVRAYATSKYGTSYGQELSFKTLISSKLPKVETSIISDITQKSAFSGGKILNDGDLDIITKGVVWSKNPNPKLWLLANKTKDGNGNENYISIIDKLSPFETYYVRAYATNSAGTGYGNELTFKTTTAAIVPSLTTTPVTSITSKTAVSGGNISSDGGSNVTARGVVWSTSPNPTVSLTTKTTNGNGIGTFTSDMIDLLVNTTYYVRAYATNSAGTGYGNEVSFKTTPAAVVPTLTTIAVSSITSKTAVSGGNISSDGGSNVTIRGVVWSTSPNPTISLTTKTTNGSGIGSFTSDMIDLLANTTYYVRAYATNSAGTGYGNEISFRTLVANNEKGQPCTDIPSYKDIDGNTYNTVQIGTQCWTKENLRVSKYRDGTLILFDESGGTTGNSLDETWSERITGARAVYGNNAQNIVTYGYLYNWYTVENPKGLCPSGWHVPSRSEFDKLVNYLGGEEIAGGKMKTTGTTFWKSPNEGATNESGFSGLPGGYRDRKGEYLGIGLFGAYWSSTNIDINDPEVWVLSIESENRLVGWTDVETLEMGASIRCLKDTVINNTASLPTLTTTSVSAITGISANTGGNITNDGGASITVRGVIWSTSPNPTIALSTKTTQGTGIGSFTSIVSNLTINTTYYVRAYATNSAGTGYGNELTFKTTTAAIVPTLTTTPVTSITSKTAVSGGNISSDGGSNVTLRGVVWSTNPNPTVSLTTKTTNGGGIGAFTSDMLDLLVNTTYYVRAYAINGAGTGYGNELTFKTTLAAVVPTLTTAPVSSITSKTAVSGGNISSDGGSNVTIRGVVWSTNPNPTVSLTTKTTNGNGIGTFTSEMNELLANTTYYVRAYATNSAATGYGNELTFKTTPASVVPTLTTTAVTSITSKTAVGGGNISSDGGSNVTARGVVWSTNPNPTISLTTKTTNGTGIGTFTSEMNDLLANTTYYVRAYATNSAGTGYGNEISFTTSDSSNVMGIPCPGTPTVKDIDGNTYNTVQIGTQCWTKENLRVTKYRDGTIIPLDESGGTTGNGTGQTWSSRTTGARTVYGHNAANLATYGYLYNLYAVADSKGLCPNGWHVPSDSEWTTLTTYLGGESVAGRKMKSIGTTYWNDPNRGATNESGFSALPGGYREADGSFDDIRYESFFWSVTELDYNDYFAWYRLLYYSDGSVDRLRLYNKQYGISVRCLKDTFSIVSVPTLTTAITAITTTSATSGGNITSDVGVSITARGVVWSTMTNPVITLTTKTSNGTGTGSFTSNLTNLTPKTTYYIRAYATNSNGTGYGNEISFTTSDSSNVMGIPCPGTPTVKDIDGNTYNTVQIGTQCWTKENLRVTKYRDGTIIPLDESGGLEGNGSGETWSSRKAGARTVYEHSAANLVTYGYLYNWYAVADTKGLCPSGWHVPGIIEWNTLTTYLGGESVAGGKMKSIGTSYWESPNLGATNEVGFSALPGGSRADNDPFTGLYRYGRFDVIKTNAIFWTDTEVGSKAAWSRGLCGDCYKVFIDEYPFKSFGASVRCLKD